MSPGPEQIPPVREVAGQLAWETAAQGIGRANLANRFPDAFWPIARQLAQRDSESSRRAQDGVQLQ